MIQAFAIRGADGGVRFRNKFVRTKKFVDEQAAGRFLYATWCTQAPGGVLANLFGRSMANQAGVTVMVRSGRLYAFDETAQPYELDPETLETIGLSQLGLPSARRPTPRTRRSIRRWATGSISVSSTDIDSPCT